MNTPMSAAGFMFVLHFTHIVVLNEFEAVCLTDYHLSVLLITRKLFTGAIKPGVPLQSFDDI